MKHGMSKLETLACVECGIITTDTCIDCNDPCCVACGGSPVTCSECADGEPPYPDDDDTDDDDEGSDDA